jgi:hypothetical protein
MRTVLIVATALLLAGSARAEPPFIPKSDTAKSDAPPKKPTIKFQDVAPPSPKVDPAPNPAPAPDPAAVSKLTPDLVYIAIQSDTPFLLFASPPGLVKVTKDTGPLKVRGKFSDGAGAYETRTVTAKYVAFVEAAGIGRVELIAVPVGADAESGATRKLLDVDDGTKPIPPPAPEPIPAPKPIPPTPKPLPAPIGSGGFIVVVADDSAGATVAAAKLYDGPTLRAYKAAGKCRVYGAAVDAAKLAGLGYDKMMAAESMTAPCVLVVDKAGHSVAAFELPASETILAAKLKEVMAP